MCIFLKKYITINFWATYRVKYDTLYSNQTDDDPHEICDGYSKLSIAFHRISIAFANMEIDFPPGISMVLCIT